MPWLTIITTLLNFAYKLVSWLHDKQLLDAGAQQEIAKQSMQILELTEKGKEIRQKIEAMSDPELDDWLKQLGED